MQGNFLLSVLHKCKLINCWMFFFFKSQKHLGTERPCYSSKACALITIGPVSLKKGILWHGGEAAVCCIRIYLLSPSGWKHEICQHYLTVKKNSNLPNELCRDCCHFSREWAFWHLGEAWFICLSPTGGNTSNSHFWHFKCLRKIRLIDGWLADKGREGVIKEARGKMLQRLTQFSLCLKFTHFRMLTTIHFAIRNSL